MGNTDLSIVRPPAQPTENSARRGPSGTTTAVWLIGAFVLILLIFGWIVALMCVVGLFCVGFLLSRQKREEQESRRSGAGPTPYPRSTASEDRPSRPNPGSGPHP